MTWLITVWNERFHTTVWLCHDDDDDDGTHICKIFCNFKSTFTYITVLCGLAEAQKIKYKKILLPLLESEFFLVFVSSLVKPQRGEN